MSTYQTEGIILKKRPLGESDRLYSIFTLSHGKIEAVADGAAKITSKLAASLEPFNFCQLLIANGRYFERLAGAKVSKKYDYLKLDWTTLTLSWALAEGLLALTYSHLPEPRIYYLLKELFSSLFDNQQREEKIFLIIQFFWLVFFLLGQRAMIREDILSNSNQKIYFDKTSGHIFGEKDNFQLLPKEKYLVLLPEIMGVLREIDRTYQKEQNLYRPKEIDKNILKIFYSLFINQYQILTSHRFNSFQFLTHV